MRNTKQEVLLMGETITGTLQRNIRPPLDVPKYVDLFMAGKLPIDRLITRNYSLDHVNEAVQASEKGELIRSVIRFQRLLSNGWPSPKDTKFPRRRQ